MKIKKYIAKDFKTAINQAKGEMGSDAIILHTRTLKKNGLLGLFLPAKVEVTVAVDETLKVNTDDTRHNAAHLNSKAQNKVINMEPAPDESEIVKELQKMKDMMNDIKTKMYEVELIKGLGEEAQIFYEVLVNNNVDPEIALAIVNQIEPRLPREKLDDMNWIQDVCLHTLQEYITNIKPPETDTQRNNQLVFLVGPTGVGKTTTIAKMAANMTFLEGKDVALITLDTYRISAADQLRTFAEIIGIPISVVFTPEDMLEAITKYQDKDIVFVDTAGRSPHNDLQMQEIKQFVEMAKPDETILVLSATTNSADLIQICNRFSTLGIDKLIFTKMDETYRYGQILNAMHEVRIPVAFFTNGQNVPDDIQTPDYHHLARMLLRKDEA